MNSKMTTNSQLSTTEPPQKNQNKNKLSKQLEQEQNHRNGEHGGLSAGMGRMGEKVHGIRSINSSLRGTRLIIGIKF